MARLGSEIEEQLGLPPRTNYNSSDSTNSGSVEETIRSLGTAGRIGLPAVASSVLSYLRGDPEETTEVVTPEVVAPEVVAPEVVTPADTQTQEAFELDIADSIQSDEDVPVAIPQEEATVEPIESVKLDNAIDGAAEEALESVVQTDDEKYADDAQYQEHGIPTGQDDREVPVVTNKIAELGYLIKERALRAVNRLDNVEYVPTGPFRMLSGLTQKTNLETINKFLKQAVGYKASDFKNTGGVDPKLDVSKEGINWCAAFVNHILTELGADTLGKGKKGYDNYLRLRADAYKDYGQDIYTRKDGLENYGKPIDFNSMQEGDVILIDFDPPGKDGHGQVDHVGFWAGNNVLGQQEGFVSVIGGNQGPSDNFIDPALQGQEKYGVTIKRNTYRNANILGVRRITYDNDAAIIAEDQKSRDRMSIFHGLEPSAASFISTDEVNASNAPRKSLTPLVRPDTLPTPTTDFEGNPIKTYAQGGLTSMNDQTQMAFALGGQAETVDPVSGNDVPPGSLPEEVRDDIDAKLSEGEYVVPADVVRFFGVKYFEDLRTEAKMGLQQMDADGRIGGEPVQEQPQGQDDSMDVAELKAALSSSGMYAGGLTDGNSLDNFIDDASRDPMVNGRMRAGGATVKMAVGGLVPSGTYDDVTKVDGIIKQLMTAANNDPSLMNKLATKGIMLNKTGADKKPNEMQQANRPNEPIMAAEGALVEPRAFKLGGDIAENKNPFDLSSFETLGRNLFEAAGIKDPLEAVNNTLLNAEGKLEIITLIAPDGTEIDVAWNTAMPLPPGFTRKDTDDSNNIVDNSNVTPEAYVANPNKQTARETGDNSGPNTSGTTINRPSNSVALSNSVAPSSKGTGSFLSKPKDFRELSIDDLQSTLNKAQRNANLASIGGFVFGPLAAIFGMAVKANSAIVERRIENELARRAGEQNVLDITKIKGIDSEKISALLADLNIKTVLGEDKKPVDREEKSVKGFFGKIIGNIADKFFDPIAERRDSLFNNTNIAANTVEATPVDKVASMQEAQNTANVNRKEKERREAAEAAARASAQVSDNAERVRGTTGSYYTGDTGSRGERYFNTSGGGGAYTDSSGTNQYLGGGDQNWTNPTNEREKTERDAARSYGEGAGSGNVRGGRYTGGLVSIPATKKKKKQTTQRRKGLGTRP